MQLNPFAISGILIIIFYLPLFIFLLIRSKTKIAKVFLLYILTILLWGVGCTIIALSKNPSVSLAVWKPAYAAVLFVAVFFFQSVLIITQSKNRWILPIVYIQALYFTYTIIEQKMMASVRLVFDSFYFHIGTPTFTASFVIWTSIFVFGFIKLIIHYKTCYPKEKKQIRLLILTIIGFAGGITDFLPGLGIDFYPYGNFIIPILSMLVTYAILKYQLLDIEVVIKKSIIYSLLIAFITVFYLVLVVLFERLAQGYLGYKSIAFSIFIAFSLGLLFIPLRNRIQYFVDKLFFHRSPDEIVEENKRLMQEVEKVDQLRGVATLAGGIAHEIRNPLTAINTFAEQLPGRLNDKAFLKKFSRIVGSEVTRINDLVNDLLNYAKPSPPKRAPVAICQLIDETIELLSNAFLKYKIDVLRDYAAKPTVNIDARQIRQALINLLSNALEAMPGGGTLTITVKQSTISSLLIAVNDTGPGIPEKTLQNIFTPFYTTKDGGTGLGLSVTKGIIEQHGGSLTARNHPEGGAEFTIELPL